MTVIVTCCFTLSINSAEWILIVFPANYNSRRQDEDRACFNLHDPCMYFVSFSLWFCWRGQNSWQQTESIDVIDLQQRGDQSQTELYSTETTRPFINNRYFNGFFFFFGELFFRFCFVCFWFWLYFHLFSIFIPISFYLFIYLFTYLFIYFILYFRCVYFSLLHVLHGHWCPGRKYIWDINR
jgi:hypothetical protein